MGGFAEGDAVQVDVRIRCSAVNNCSLTFLV